MNKVVIVGVLGMVTLIAAISFWQRTSSRPTSSLDSVSADSGRHDTVDSAVQATSQIPKPPTPPEVPNPADSIPAQATPITSAQLDPVMARLFAEKIGPKMLHARLEKQKRDVEWATAEEEKWRQYLAGKAGLVSYGIPEVQCGTELCEIRMTTHGTGEEVWAELLSGKSVAPKPDANNTGMDWISDNGALAIAMYVTYPSRR